MGSVAVGFVEFGGWGTGGVGGVADFFEIADKFFAAGGDEELGVAEFVTEAGVDTVDAVADVGVDVSLAAGDLDFTSVIGSEVLADEMPVGCGG